MTRTPDGSNISSGYTYYCSSTDDVTSLRREAVGTFSRLLQFSEFSTLEDPDNCEIPSNVKLSKLERSAIGLDENHQLWSSLRRDKESHVRVSIVRKVDDLPHIRYGQRMSTLWVEYFKLYMATVYIGSSILMACRRWMLFHSLMEPHPLLTRSLRLCPRSMSEEAAGDYNIS